MDQASKKLAVMCTVIYFVSYLERHNYAAVIAEIIASGIASESAAAVTTVGFVVYGFGQLVSGFFGDWLPPRKLIFLGLLLTAWMNLLLPFCQTVWQMCLVWGVNGGAQALLWPPMVKLLSVLSDQDYRCACKNVTIGGAAGTIFIYCLVPLILTIGNWRMVFFICALFGMAATVFWGTEIGKALSGLPKPAEEKKTEREKKFFPASCIPMILLVLFAIICQGLLRDGITTWTPVYLNQVYRLTTAVSILITVFIPVLSVIGIQFAAKLHQKVFTDELKCAMILFFAGAASGLMLSIVPISQPLLFAVGAAVITACMHGVNLMLITIFPRRYQQFGRIAMISGLLNFSTYLGSAFSSIGFEWISQYFGWHWVVNIWMMISAAGAWLCWMAQKKKFPQGE